MNIPKKIDYIVTRIILFIIFLLWIRYFVRNIFISLLFAALAVAVVSVVMHFAFRLRRKKVENNAKKSRAIKDFTRQLIYSETAYQLDYFASVLSSRYCVLRREDCLIVQNTDTAVFLRFSHNKLTAFDIADIYKRTRAYDKKSALIITNGMSSAAAVEAKSIGSMNISFYSESDAYLLAERAGIYPETAVTAPEKKKLIKVREFIAFAIDKKKAKSYFLSSLALVFASLILSYSLYYIIFASVLLIMTVLCLFDINLNGRKDAQPLL